ncbi:twin-arginine translocation signal domain-containing protein [Kineobactrum salinum]|uniref:Twin-arginine translocation signal domain-containing protein n=1 Tax=Kineobactrum salinum TaxID=2708301 RepID=A0A6C0U2X7_9GAMM|nr:twin-arginine translocation signal domain-containing protein [Kineobactrum salinum]QIB66451.1 twin-arginine translocation signal domain-containing protein [Kineobactrum salinum]
MITRRDFVVAGLAAGGTAAVIQLLYLPGDADGSSATSSLAEQQLNIVSGLGVRMDELLQSLEGADRLGESWIGSLAAAPSLRELGTIVDGRIDLQAPDLGAATAQRVRQDFVDNQLCELDGWQLSLLECQLAGLRHLAIAADPANLPLMRAREQAALQESLTEGEIAPLANWGPRKTVQGQKFNEQADGHSGLWFQFDNAPNRARIMIDGELARTRVSSKVVTSGLFGEMQDRILATPGEYEIALVDPIKKIKQPVGMLVVEPDPALATDGQASGTGFCEISKWGPRQTTVGVAPNVQPDGSMGLWVHTDCLPEGTELLFVDDVLGFTRTSFGLTARIPLALLESPGDKPVYLHNPRTGNRQLIGKFRVQE